MVKQAKKVSRHRSTQLAKNSHSKAHLGNGMGLNISRLTPTPHLLIIFCLFTSRELVVAPPIEVRLPALNSLCI
jgi:hypothetical protein